MSVLSWIRRNRQQAKQYKAKMAEQKIKEASKVPYRHVVKHALQDSLTNAAPPSWRYEQSHLIVEQNRRRTALTLAGAGVYMPRNSSALSHVSFPADYADSVLHDKAVPRSHSYAGYPISAGAAYFATPMIQPGSASRSSLGKAASPAHSSSDSNSSQEELEMKMSRRMRHSLPIQSTSLSVPTSDLRPHLPRDSSIARTRNQHFSDQPSHRLATLGAHPHRASVGPYFRAPVPLTLSGALPLPITPSHEAQTNTAPAPKLPSITISSIEQAQAMSERPMPTPPEPQNSELVSPVSDGDESPTTTTNSKALVDPLAQTTYSSGACSIITEVRGHDNQKSESVEPGVSLMPEISAKDETAELSHSPKAGLVPAHQIVLPRRGETEANDIVTQPPANEVKMEQRSRYSAGRRSEHSQWLKMRRLAKTTMVA